MPIEKGLEGITGKELEVAKPEVEMEPLKVIPFDKINATFISYCNILPYAHNIGIIEVETAVFEPAYENFQCYRNFFLALRKHFDEFLSRCNEWKKMFGVLVTEESLKQETKARVPDSTKYFLSNRLVEYCKLLDSIECPGGAPAHVEIDTACKNVDNALSDLEHASNVVEVYLAGSTLAADIAFLDNLFSIGDERAGTMTGQKFVKNLDMIHSFCDGKSTILYNYYFNRLKDFKDLSPKPPRKKFLGII